MWGSDCQIFSLFLCNVLHIIACPFILEIALSVLLRFTASDYQFGIFKFFLRLFKFVLRQTHLTVRAYTF
jgi:hypothetical protein